MGISGRKEKIIQAKKITRRVPERMARVRIQENILKETKAEMQKQRTQRSKTVKIEKDSIKSRSR